MNEPTLLTARAFNQLIRDLCRCPGPPHVIGRTKQAVDDSLAKGHIPNGATVDYYEVTDTSPPHCLLAKNFDGELRVLYWTRDDFPDLGAEEP